MIYGLPCLLPAKKEAARMSERTSSDLVEIAKRNGNFKRNYGKLIGAYLYVRSVNAVRGRSLFWTGLIGLAFLVSRFGSQYPADCLH